MAQRNDSVMQLDRGDTVHIPCSISNGPFPDELLVTFESADGTVSGFVSADDVVRDEKDSNTGKLRARVIEVGERGVKVALRGSFFTTAGVSWVPRDAIEADAITREPA